MRAPKEGDAVAYLLDRSSVGSGGSATSLPSMGKTLNSRLNRGPSLCGKAARILASAKEEGRA